MARAVAPDERIGLLVESRADVSGFRQARQENSALAREAKAAAAEMAGGAQQGATAQQSLANAARAAADSTAKVTLSAEQSRRMWAQAGGDYSRFLELVRAHVAEQKALAAATAEATAAQQAQNQAQAGGRVAGGIGPGGRQPSPVPPLAQELDKIPAKARTAANALSMMAFTAVDGSGGLRSLTVAAGTAADGLATLSGSARVAASAAGIGALATVLVAAIVLLDRAKDKAREAGAAIAGSLGAMTDEALAARAQIAQVAFERQVEKLAALREKGGGIFGIDVNIPEIVRAENDLERLAAQREAIFQERLDRRRNAGRDAAREIAEQERRDAERSKTLLDELAAAHLDMYERRTQSAETAARLKAEREFSEQRTEIDALRIHEDQKTALIAAAARVRAETIARINADARARELEEERKHYERVAKVQEDRLERVADMMQNVLLTTILSEDSFGKAFGRIVGAAIVKHLAMLAVRHSIEALANAAFGLWGHAARHAAVATAAGIGARQVAQMAGISGGESSVAAGPTLSTQNPHEAGSNMTVIIQTVDPTSREVLGQTAWYLERSKVLKRPTNAPTTTIGPSLAGVYA